MEPNLLLKFMCLLWAVCIILVLILAFAKKKVRFESGKTYYCHHKLTKENWYIIGISKDFKHVCAAGWPPSIAKMEDCTKFELHGQITDHELEYRRKQFGEGWL